MRFTIRKADTSDVIVRAAIHTLFDDTFAKGEWSGKPSVSSGHWWIAHHNGDAAAFAGMVPSSLAPLRGYFKAAGVLPKYRGHGLQKRLIQKRLDHARKLGWTSVVTETLNYNAASANSLIRCGFRVWLPDEPWGSPYAVYWKREL